MLPNRRRPSKVIPIDGNSSLKRTPSNPNKRSSYGDLWISETFNKKECTRFVGRLSRPEICKCGRTLNQHEPSVLDPISETTDEIKSAEHDSLDQPPDSTERQQVVEGEKGTRSSREGSLSPIPLPENASKPWDRVEDIIETPTDSFGTIDFIKGNRDKHVLQRPTKPKYIRVSDTTKPQTILELLNNCWNLTTPDIVISIAGGAKNYHMDSQLQDAFTSKLVKALHGTSAWFITSGINQGIAQSVGKVVREYQELSWAGIRKTGAGSLQCIGVSSWGYLEGRECLVKPNSKGLNLARYEEPNLDEGSNSSSLNSDHTHFILVDDGTVGKYGFELELRANLEKCIALPKDDAEPDESGLGVPVVVLAVEGGINAILTVCQALSRNIPAVVFEGSGRAADIIAYAHKHCIQTRDGRQLNPSNVPTIKRMLQNTYSSQKADFGVLLKKINLSMKNENLLTLYHMDKDAQLDFVISTALLKAESGSVFNQLKIALTWNNIAVAKSLFTKEIHQNMVDNFSSLMTIALVENKIEFIRLFLNSGLSMKNYLTVSRLQELYNTNVSKNNVFRRLMRIQFGLQTRDNFTLQDIDYLLKKLLYSHNEPMYLTEQMKNNSNGKDLENSLVLFSGQLIGGTMDLEVSNDLIYQAKFENPYQEVFIWAILTDRIQIAECLWKAIENPLASSIIASLLFRAISRYFKDLEFQKKYQNHAQKFDQLSLSFLNLCYKKNEDLTENLIQRSYSRWGDKDIFTLGAKTKNKEFKFHPCCQNVLNKIWKNGMQHSSFTLFLALFIPVLISNLKFSSYALYQRLTFNQKVKAFYSAPIIKFYGFAITYIIFLLIFSYTILVDINQDQLGVCEWFVFIWIAILVFDEIQQALIPQENETVKIRFLAWAKSGWNILDAVTMILGIITFIMRFHAELKDVCRALYAINGALFYLRIIRLLSFSATLGPKLVMIRKMVKEMFFFLVILMIFLVAYGVAGNALWHPYRKTFYWEIISDVLYFPYFQTYGELFLTEISQNNNCTSLTGREKENCTEYHPLLVVFLACYLLIGNILLLNLLIAIFSYIFEEVQTNSLRVWKLEMYNLVSEFEDRPILPPPLMIFEIVADFFRWLFHKICCKTRAKNDFRGKRRKLTAKIVGVLDNFEKECSVIFKSGLAMRNPLSENSSNPLDMTTKDDFTRKQNRLSEIFTKPLDMTGKDDSSKRLNPLSETITKPLDVMSKDDSTRIVKDKKYPHKYKKSSKPKNFGGASTYTTENLLHIAVSGKKHLKNLKRRLTKEKNMDQALLEADNEDPGEKEDPRIVADERTSKSDNHSEPHSVDAVKYQEDMMIMNSRLQRIEGLLEAILNQSSSNGRKDTESTSH